MMKYIFFDIFYTEIWMDDFLSKLGLDTDEVQNDGAISLEFENNGFGSK